jgi:SAM-dependent methyltransferase
MSSKDFGPIAADYDFFLAHSTEAASGLREYRRELDAFRSRAGRGAVRLLDFGCGAGDFTGRFLAELDWPRDRLDLTLVEPVESQREAAVARLSSFTDAPIAHAPALPQEPEPPFDLILSNHVLYYVDDVEASLGQLNAALAPGGLMLLALAGWDNALMRFWQAGFALIERPVPYHAAEDVETALDRLGVRFRKVPSPYEIRFPDSFANRMHILRFLFGEYLDIIPRAALLAGFDPYLRGDHVEIATRSDHFAVPGRDGPLGS